MPTHILTISKPDKSGLTLTDESGSLLYTVSQEDFTAGGAGATKHVARVQGGEGEVLATMEYTDDLKFWVSYGTGERVEMDEWAHVSSLPFHHDVTIKGAEGGKFKWKIHKEPKKMELFTDASSTHVAHVADGENGAEIHIDESVWGSRDLIVVSFLFLFRKQRVTSAAIHGAEGVMGAGGNFRGQV